MNTMKLRKSWNETAGKLKQHFANLTDEDTHFPNGKEDEILGRLKAKLETQRKVTQIDFKIINNRLS